MVDRTGVMGLLAMLALAASATTLRAQPSPSSPDPLTPVRSMGKPPVWKPFTGGYYGLDRSGDQTHDGGGAYLGLYKDLLPSIVGIGASAEGVRRRLLGSLGRERRRSRARSSCARST